MASLRILETALWTRVDLTHTPSTTMSKKQSGSLQVAGLHRRRCLLAALGSLPSVALSSGALRLI
jgi:hypothetical protein